MFRPMLQWDILLKLFVVVSTRDSKALSKHNSRVFSSSSWLFASNIKIALHCIA